MQRRTQQQLFKILRNLLLTAIILIILKGVLNSIRDEGVLWSDKVNYSFTKSINAYNRSSSFRNQLLPNGSFSPVVNIKAFISQKEGNINYVWEKETLEQHNLWNYRGFIQDELYSLSKLGKRLFLHEKVGNIQSERQFLINVYKFGKALKPRLQKNGTIDPFAKCSVKNCLISYSDQDFDKADAVLFHLHKMKSPPSKLRRKNYQQRWVWLSDESPYNTLFSSKSKDISQYDGMFNWSMTYRFQSDVPVPYGRVVPLMGNMNPTSKELDVYTRKKKNVAIMGSNCRSGKNNRWLYVKSLKKYIKVDSYGKCGTLKCTPRSRYQQDCSLLNEYKFYLAFENSNCHQYITEKLWLHGFAKESVPVLMGPPKEDYQKLLPPNSFIYAEDFKTPKELAQYLLYLSSNKEAYNKFHEWRRHFAVVNEHGYFGADILHYCRLCEALNYNSRRPKTYHSMESFWNKSRDCYPPKWSNPDNGFRIKKSKQI